MTLRCGQCAYFMPVRLITLCVRRLQNEGDFFSLTGKLDGAWTGAVGHTAPQIPDEEHRKKKKRKSAGADSRCNSIPSPRQTHISVSRLSSRNSISAQYFTTAQNITIYVEDICMCLDGIQSMLESDALLIMQGNCNP